MTGCLGRDELARAQIDIDPVSFYATPTIRNNLTVNHIFASMKKQNQQQKSGFAFATHARQQNDTQIHRWMAINK